METAEFEFEADEIDPSANDFSFLVEIDGITANPDVDGDHRYNIYLNDHLVEEAVWDGVELFQAELSLPIDYLRNGKNKIFVEYQETGSPYDLAAVEGFTVTYSRRLAARENAITFEVSSPEENIKISGFTNQGIEVFDVTDADEPISLSDARSSGSSGAYTVEFANAAKKGKAARYMAAAAQSAYLKPEIGERYSTGINSPDNQADYLIISYDAFVPALAPLIELRKEQGRLVKVATTSEIYDQFDYGNAGEQAIASFLKYAAEQWEQAPRDVLLVGDATNDPDDYLGLGVEDYVPTHLLAPRFWSGVGSDNWYADVDSDGDYDFNIGRLPAATPEEAGRMIEKIIALESAASSHKQSNRIIVIADAAGTAASEDFTSMASDILAMAPEGYEKIQINFGDFDDAEAARAKVIEELDQGSALVIYIGHSSGMSWGGRVEFAAGDVANLSPDVVHTLVISLSCVAGYMTYPGVDSMAEAFVKAERGGAAAAWMPADAGTPAIHEQLIGYFFERFLRESQTPPADIIREALNDLVRENGSTQAMTTADTFIYFGDPALARLEVEPLENQPDTGNGNAQEGMIDDDQADSPDGNDFSDGDLEPMVDEAEGRSSSGCGCDAGAAAGGGIIALAALLLALIKSASK
jgi:hypothetical protein